MGNSNSRRYADRAPFKSITFLDANGKDSLPVYFNPKVHGENIVISEDKMIAKRIRSYCKGICYSNRPISPNELVSVRIRETSDEWSGVLRLGFVSYDPNENGFKFKNSHEPQPLNTQSSAQLILPKYSCPDLTNKNGNWAKALPLNYAIKDNFLSFYYDLSGNVHYVINGHYIGVLLNGLNIKGQNLNKSKLWALFDVYGNTISLEIIYPMNTNEIQATSEHIPFSKINGHCKNIKNVIRNEDINSLTNHCDGLKKDKENISRSVTPNSAHPSASCSRVHSSISRYYNSPHDSNGDRWFDVLPFHSHPSARGKNVHVVRATIQPTTPLNNISDRFGDNIRRGMTKVSVPSNGLPHNYFDSDDNDQTAHDVTSHFVGAARLDQEFCNAYVFTARPVPPNHKVVVKVLATEASYVGSLAFGLTACDPATLHPRGCLPDDANFLIDRPEYWVVAKDVITDLEIGDELAFYVDSQGQVTMERNGYLVGGIMYVDTTQKLWAFWDLYGNAKKIQILGSYHMTLSINELQNQRQLRRNLPRPSTAAAVPSSTLPHAANNSNPFRNNDNTQTRNPYDVIDFSTPAPTDHQNRSNFDPPRSTNPTNAPLNSLIPQCIYDISPRFQSMVSTSLTPATNSNTSSYNGSSSISSGAKENFGRRTSATTCSPSPVASILNVQIAPRRPLNQICHTNSSQSHPMALSTLTSHSTTSTPDHFHHYSLMRHQQPVENLSNNELIDICYPTRGTHPDNITHNGDSFANVNLSFNGNSPPIEKTFEEKISLGPDTKNLKTSTDDLAPNVSHQQECVVCYERSLDCLLYPCGHVCMCYVCAIQTWKMLPPNIANNSTSSSTTKTLSDPLGLCPICRCSIKEVVKIFFP